MGHWTHGDFELFRVNPPFPRMIAALPADVKQPATGIQLVVLWLIALYLINLIFGFSGTFTQLKKYDLVSSALTGVLHGTPSDNLFRGSLRGGIPVPRWQER